MASKDKKDRSPRGRTRVLIPDIVRGVTVVSMVLFHGMWDAVFLHGLSSPWYSALPGYVWQQSICWSFLLVSGYCFRFDRKPAVRGAVIFGCGALISLVTVLFLPEEQILFGVLTLIGSSILLTAGLDGILRKAGFPGTVGGHGSGCAGKCSKNGRKYAVLLLCAFALFLLTRNVNEGTLGFEGASFGRLPASWYRNLFTAYLGFPPPSFWSTDYFSLIPWYFLYLTGYFLSFVCPADRLREAERKLFPDTEPPVFLRPVLWIGRHAFLIYLLHQPVLFLLFAFR